MSLRLGIVGCGAVALHYHVPAVAASRDVRLTHVCDPDPKRAAAIASASGVDVARSSRVEELVGNVDAAIVAVPNHLHAVVAVPLLEAGVHVLVEKPMAVDVAGCDTMIAAADGHGSVLSVGHDFRFFPVAAAARELLASDVFGSVVRVDVRQSATGRWPYASDYIFSRGTAGGGVLIDFGVHVIDLLGWWLGNLTVVACRDDAFGGVEAECELELELGTHVPVWFELSRARPLRDTALIECERATLEIGIFEPALLRMTLRGSSRPIDGDVRDAEFDRSPLQTVFARQLADFVHAIVTSSRPVVSGHDGRRAVAIVEDAYAMRTRLDRPWDVPNAYAAIGQEAPFRAGA